MLPQEAVVVDLAVDGEDDGLVGVGKGLRAGFWSTCKRRSTAASRRHEGQPTDTDDAEALVAQDCERVSEPSSTPADAASTYLCC